MHLLDLDVSYSKCSRLPVSEHPTQLPKSTILFFVWVCLLSAACGVLCLKFNILKINNTVKKCHVGVV